MARSEARLLVEIWSDKDFLARDTEEQRMFMFLLSQPDLAHTGVIPLRDRRWVSKAKGLTRERVERSLEGLAEGRFVVIDWDAGEVLVRSFLRRDRVYRQPNVMRAAVDHVALIESPLILRALLAETSRIAAENPDLTKHQADMVSEMENVLVKRLKAEEPASPVQPSGNPTGNPSGNPSAHRSANGTAATPGERGDVRRVSTDIPDSPLIRLPAAPASPQRGTLALVADPGPEPRTTDEIVAWWIERCDQRPAKQVIGQISKHVKDLLGQDFQPAHIREGIAEYAAKEVHPSVLPSLVTAIANRRAPIRAAPGATAIAPSDRKFAANAQLAAQLRAQEGHHP